MGDFFNDCRCKKTEFRLRVNLERCNGEELFRVIERMDIFAVRYIRRSQIIDLIDEIAVKENPEPKLAEGIVLLLMKLNDTRRARFWLEKKIWKEKFRLLKLAELDRREGNLQKMKKLLEQRKPSHSLDLDEWRYLRFFILEMEGELEKGDSIRRRISNPEYIMRSKLLLAERCLAGLDYSRAEKYLSDALGFFLRCGWEKEMYECRRLLAKSAWERNILNGEKDFQELWNECSAGEFPDVAVLIAIDLGKVYLDRCDWRKAGEWGYRAEKKYEKENIKEVIGELNSFLGTIEVLNGDWKNAEDLFKQALKYNQREGFIQAEGVALLDIARLEYLRLDFSAASKTAAEAKKIFLKCRNWSGYVKCLFLLAKNGFCCHKPGDFPGLPRRFINKDQSVLLQIFQYMSCDHLRAEKLLKVETLLDQISSLQERFDLMVILRRFYGWNVTESHFKKKVGLNQNWNRFFCFESKSLKWEGSGIVDSGSIDSYHRKELWELIDYFHLNRRILPNKIQHLHCILSIRHSVAVKPPPDEMGFIPPVEESIESVFARFVKDLEKQVGAEGVQLEFPGEEEKILSNLKTDEDRRETSSLIRECIGVEWRVLSEVTGRMFSSAWVGRWRISLNMDGYIMLGFFRKKCEKIDYISRYRAFFSEYALLFRRYFEGILNEHEGISHILGESRVMRKLKGKIIRVSKVPFSLLITGESGTGKELVARAVHYLGLNSQKPFVCVNSAAIPENLLEAELFGFKKGAFTGAVENRTGLIESAREGTLFLDEIADLSLPLQAKLLRALQEREIRRIGENRSISVDFRLISASNKDLSKMVRNGGFREDLYYRLQDLTIHVPPLRERIEDLPVLIDHFLKKHSGGLAEKRWVNYLFEMFRGREFRGNIRELESEVKKAITFSPFFLAGEDAGANCLRGNRSLKEAREMFERDFLHQALKENDWNRNATASGLKISRMTLFNLMKKYNLLFPGSQDGLEFPNH